MANSNKLQQSKTNDRVPGLKGSSGCQRRFQQYCARTSLFPPPPPVTPLTAVQRLKRFKAICKKQQLAATNGKKSLKKNLATTLIVRKKGIRKSATPGKSPFIKSARKSISRKELLRIAQAHNMKVLTAGMDNGVSNPYNNLDKGEQDDQPTFSAGNIRDRKKELLKKLYAGEKAEQKSFTAKSSTQSFVEYPEDNGSNDSEEIDVVSNRYEVIRSNQVSTNGTANGGNDSFEIFHGNSNIKNGDSRKNGDTVENAELDAKSEDLESKNSSLEIDENATVRAVPEILGRYSEEVNIEVVEEIPSDKPVNGGNRGESDEDSLFDAVLQAPVEKNSLPEGDAEIDEGTLVFETTFEAPEAVIEPAQATCDQKAVFVTAEIHAETNELCPETIQTEKFNVLERNVESSSKTEESLIGSNCHGESNFEENESPSLASDKQKSKKKTKPRKSSIPVKEATLNTETSSKRKSQKRKSLTPISVKKSKSKKESSVELIVEKPENTVVVKRSNKRRVTPIFKVSPAHIESHAYFSSGNSVLGTPTSDNSPMPEFSTDEPGNVAAVSKQRSKEGSINSEVSNANLDSSECLTKAPHVTESISKKAEGALNKGKSKKSSGKSKTSTEDFKRFAHSWSESHVSAFLKSDASSTAEMVTKKAEDAVSKSKGKRGSQTSESSGETSVSAFVKPRTSPFLEVVVEEAEKSFISSDSEKDVEPLKSSPMVRRSQFKWMEPKATCSKDKIEKTPVITPVQQDVGEPSTSKFSGRTRSQKSFSLSRRAPLRSTRGSGTSIFESTRFDSTPSLKRKSDVDVGNESAKRLKEEMYATPRWNILSSPLKSYWSPQLTNKISYKQPESSLTPDQFSSISEPETPSSDTKANESDNNSKTWCTIS